MKKLIIFNALHGPNIRDLSEDSNSWYLKNYEQYFDKVYHVSLTGSKKETIQNGNSFFILAGAGTGYLNLLLAPFKLYRLVQKISPQLLVTYEQVWSWWITLFVRLFYKTKIILLPLTFPEQMYKVTGKAISGIIPIWLERRFLNLSYRTSDRLITSRNLGNYVNWMKENRIISRKLLITDSMPESVVFPAFMKRLEAIEAGRTQVKKDPAYTTMIYVGRIHIEKMTDHLIKALPLIREAIPNVRLRVIGQGEDKASLITMAAKLGVSEIIEWLDYQPHSKLPLYLLSSDIFVSPSTGHAFREAAICGLPIVAYNIDWIKGFLVPGEHFYGLDEIDAAAFAGGVIAVCKNEELKRNLSQNIRAFANRYWSSKNLGGSLEQMAKF